MNSHDGLVICRCESVTLGTIREFLRSSGAHSVNGVKKLTRAVIKDLARAVGCLPSRGFRLGGRLLAHLSPFAANVFPSSGLRINGCRLMIRRKAECVEGDRRVEKIRVVCRSNE